MAFTTALSLTFAARQAQIAMHRLIPRSTHNSKKGPHEFEPPPDRRRCLSVDGYKIPILHHHRLRPQQLPCHPQHRAHIFLLPAHLVFHLHIMAYFSRNVMHLHFAVFVIIALTPSVHAQVTGSGCVFTDRSCPCSEVESSAPCMNHIGGGNCLLGECGLSYRCDCFGYEMCTRSSCSIFTTAENSIPSQVTPFGCHLTADAGVCTSFDFLLDTLEAVDYSFSDATRSTEESYADTTKVYDQIENVRKHAADVQGALENLKSKREQLTNEEAEEIDSNAHIVLQTLTDIGQDAADISKEAITAFNVSQEVGQLRLQARSAEENAKATEVALDTEEEKAKKDGKECLVCGELQVDVARLRQLRRELAKNAGAKAKGSRKNRRKASEGRKKAEKTAIGCAEARDKVLARIEKSEKRLEAANRPGA